MSEIPKLSREERRRRGKDQRQACPRSSHADVVLGQGPRDPVALIENSNTDRVEQLLPLRFGRMSESAFAFFRGTANLQAYDLRGAPSSGIFVQCCGDCHLMNFGGFATPERTLVFDINDFDETFPAPFEWDVKRLAASVMLAGRWLEFDATECCAAAASAATAYREHIAQYADMHVLDIWYTQITLDSLLREFADNEDVRKRLKKAVAKAEQNTSERVFHKITREDNGRVRIIDQPPLLFHVDPSRLDFESDVLPFFARYRETLREDHQTLFDRFHFADAAFKVVGVGSVGTYCFVALFLSENDDPLFLQAKQARRSVLEETDGPSRWNNSGERIVMGQRLMQSASDIFLGWSKATRGRDGYVRQLRDMKVVPNLVGYTPQLLLSYASLCGQALARAHSKAGDSATIAGYLGSGNAFSDAIVRYAASYADQVERDFAAFKSAIRAGTFPVDTQPYGIESALA